MLKSIVALALLGLAVAGCTENSHATPVVAAGAAAAPVATKVDVFEGAAVGAPIAGLSGAVWADPGNTGYVTGYALGGKYHAGPPPGYDPARHAVVAPH